MTDTAQLVLATFGSGEEADDAAHRLVAWTGSIPAARLEAVAVLEKAADGTISTHKLGPRQARRGAEIGIAIGAVAGIVSSSLTVAQGALIGAAGGGAIGSLFHKGLDVDADRVEAGQAAVGVLVAERQTRAVAQKLEEYGGHAEAAESAPPEPAASPS